MDKAYKVRNLLLAVGLGLIFGAPAFAGVVDGESRQAPPEFFADPGHPKESTFIGSGSLYCGLAGIDVTAQVVVENDLLLTASHFFFKLTDAANPEAKSRLRDNLDGCFFTPFFGKAAGTRFSLRLETLRIFSSAEQGASLRFNYLTSWQKDLALVRLNMTNRPGVVLKAYELDPEPMSGPKALLTAVDGGAKTDHDFSPALQMCETRDQLESILYTDCDVQNTGPSGAALFTVKGSQLLVRAILTGHYHATSGSYARNTNSTVFVEIDEQVKKWISAYISEIH